MVKANTTTYIWAPGIGPDPAALDRLANWFPKPRLPMGEAWFLAPERRMYTELFNDLETLSDREIEDALDQTASGPSCFGPHDEWTEWYHYLLPRLFDRFASHGLISHPVELLITAFMAQHPETCRGFAYPGFGVDALASLGRFIMSGHFWPNGGIDAAKCLNKNENYCGVFGWYHAEGLLSASLFFCAKYLDEGQVGPWFQSVFSIPDRLWQAQVLTWLVGAHDILTDQIGQPAQFPENGDFGVSWGWSHVLDGHYTGDFDPPISRIPF